MLAFVTKKQMKKKVRLFDPARSFSLLFFTRILVLLVLSFYFDET